jgi:hypothetical protein
MASYFNIVSKLMTKMTGDSLFGNSFQRHPVMAGRLPKADS